VQIRRVTLVLATAFALGCAGAGLDGGRVLAAPAPAKITSCATFRDWLLQEPASTQKLMSATSDASRPPSHPDSLDASFAGATSYRSHFGGGGCLAGWYDRATGRAAVKDTMDTYVLVSLFAVATTPIGLATRSLSSLRTRRGVGLGMTVTDVRKLDGPGTASTSGTRTTLRYHWVTPPYDVQNDLTFVFERSRLIVIASGKGH
jgi:hypothetical protein